jgi:hypothetical protein
MNPAKCCLVFGYTTADVDAGDPAFYTTGGHLLFDTNTKPKGWEEAQSRLPVKNLFGKAYAQGALVIAALDESIPEDSGPPFFVDITGGGAVNEDIFAKVNHYDAAGNYLDGKGETNGKLVCDETWLSTEVVAAGILRHTRRMKHAKTGPDEKSAAGRLEVFGETMLSVSGRARGYRP